MNKALLISAVFALLTSTVALGGDVRPSDECEKAYEEISDALKKARKLFAETDTYTSLVLLEERHQGKIKGIEKIQCAFRKNPVKLYFKWLNGGIYEGLQVSYVAERDGENHFMALETGARGMLGVTRWNFDSKIINWLYPHHFRINQYHLGFLFDNIESINNKALAQKKFKVKTDGICDDLIAGRRLKVYHVELSSNPADGLPYKKSVLGIDEQTSLPLYIENYDLNDQLYERYRILSFKRNQSIDDSIFELKR